MNEQERLEIESLRRENRQLKRELRRYQDRREADGFLIGQFWGIIEDLGKFNPDIEYIYNETHLPNVVIECYDTTDNNVSEKLSKALYEFFDKYLQYETKETGDAKR